MDLLSREAATICAPITAPGQAGVSVIRVSGNKALLFSRKICPFIPSEPESHRVYYGFATDPAGARVDEVLATYFGHGKSFTGEETVEIATHGSPTILGQVLANMQAAGCLMAERGEFTYRAFSNGRIDLLQAESILSLIQSQSSQAARLALRQLQGELSDEIIAIENHLTWVAANIEAGIDFSTEDIDVIAYQEIRTRVDLICTTTSKLLGTFRRTRPALEGLKVVLLGRPNAGKSSLLNALLKRERSIVTDIPGTTRDLVEAALHLDAGTALLVDTAGLRESSDLVEKLGIDAALNAQLEADIILYLYDITLGLSTEDLRILETLDRSKVMLVATKSDLISHQTARSTEPDNLRLSTKTGTGIDELRAFLNSRLAEAFVDDGAVITKRRQYELVQVIHSRSLKSLELLQAKASLEFVALELQEAILAVLELQGKRFDDQIMDRVFKSSV